MRSNLILTPESLQVFERTIEILEYSISEMRQLANNMIPESLVKFGLHATLQDLCDHINNSGEIQLVYKSIGLENLFLDQTFSLHIFRIAEQLLNNILKEATAKKIVLSVVKQQTKITVKIDDDGVGFDTAVLTTTPGDGWNNIRNQIAFLKGTLNVHSNIGENLIRIEIPV